MVLGTVAGRPDATATARPPQDSAATASRVLAAGLHLRQGFPMTHCQRQRRCRQPGRSPRRHHPRPTPSRTNAGASSPSLPHPSATWSSGSTSTSTRSAPSILRRRSSQADPTAQLLNTAASSPPVPDAADRRLDVRPHRRQHGPQDSMVISVLMMCGGSLMIAVLPTYASRHNAPLLLLARCSRASRSAVSTAPRPPI